MKKNILFSAALMFLGLTASAQTTITFDKDDYAAIGVYDQWEESPFRTGVLQGNAAIATNPSKEVDAILGAAPNATEKVLALQRSRYASNAFGVRIDLKEPIRVTKAMQYIHVMAYLKDKPTESRMMVIGLGKRIEESWSWQTGEEEQFWAITTSVVKPKDGWQDIVVGFKGFSYAEEENAESGIEIYALVIVPDVRSPHADERDWVAYFDEIVVDNSPDKRFSVEEYALTYDEETTMTRSDRHLNGVGLNVGDKSYTAEGRDNYLYTNNTANSVFSAMAGETVQPTFDYTGNAMHGYVYVDWGNDGLFKDELHSDGSPDEGSDVVSYNAVQVDGQWRKSDGTSSASSEHVSRGVPKFTIPEDTPEGFYRMRYKVDWNCIDPAGNAAANNTILANGGGILDLMLDVHGEKVTVNASQLNGDIVLATDGRALQNYIADYEKPLKVKIVPENGFVQYGFTLKYGYNVNAKNQVDDHGNPNWIEVVVPFSDINTDGTYTIPAAYMRGSNVSISGDMQQVWKYTLQITGGEGQGGITYGKTEYTHGDVISATQFFAIDQIVVKEIDGYVAKVAFDQANGILNVVYNKIEAYRQVASLAELKDDMAYHIKAKTGEGYLAWNTLVTDNYVSLRGMTTTTPNGLPSNEAVAKIYQEEVGPFDMTVVWQILHEEGKYYLYQPAKHEYVTRVDRDYIFTAEKTPLDNIRDNGDGTFSFHAGGQYSDNSQFFACIVTNDNTTPVRNWTWNDHGAVMYIVENPNVKLIVDSIEEIVHDKTPRKGIYNLQGQRLHALPTSGVVIVDNKKYLLPGRIVIND